MAYKEYWRNEDIPKWILKAASIFMEKPIVKKLTISELRLVKLASMEETWWSYLCQEKKVPYEDILRYTLDVSNKLEEIK